ncbi:hypothetical protein C8R41DRAFT_934673 [Lentinula lateritia]|uniref:Uncharacterized protein n=1 Tax=Lentinula lateritia TaxID=40482 RepID=A0ABQ8VUB4_9AGAR|nr:hypothetical protein C8R41DRAFT_934673 [Lentinula lateritia]
MTRLISAFLPLSTLLGVTAAPGAIRTDRQTKRLSPIYPPTPPKTPPVEATEPLDIILAGVRKLDPKSRQKFVDPKLEHLLQADAKQIPILYIGGRGYHSTLSSGKWTTQHLPGNPSDGILLGTVTLPEKSKTMLFKLLDTVQLPEKTSLLLIDHLLARVKSFPSSKAAELDLTIQGLWLPYMQVMLHQGANGAGGIITKQEEAQYQKVWEEDRFKAR